jgi:hypothetical protein
MEVACNRASGAESVLLGGTIEKLFTLDRENALLRFTMGLNF